MFTKDFNRKIEKQEGKALVSIRFKKDVKIEELIQQRNESNDKESIHDVLKKMKQRNLRFSQFDKEKVLALHNPREKTEIYIEDYEVGVGNEGGVETSIIDDENKMNDSDREGGGDVSLDKKRDQGAAGAIKGEGPYENRQKGADQKKGRKRRNQYYYEKFQGRERNLTVDYAKDSPQKYFSSFKSVTRDEREYNNNKLMYQNPGVGKYYPKYKVTDNKRPPITISKADLNRTRNMLIVNPDLYQDCYPRVSRNHSLDNSMIINSVEETSRIRSQSQTMNKVISKIRPEYQSSDNDQDNSQTQQQQDDILNNNSSIDLIPYRNIQHKKHNLQPNIITPQKMRDGWNNAHGQLDLNKQSQRKFVFENMISLNEQRFNYMHLPSIYSKNKKVPGDAYFSKGSPRKELFTVQAHQPQYQPNFDQLYAKAPKYVNMNIKRVKELYHNLDD